MARLRISNRTVAQVQPGEREAFYWDTELPGFGLRVHPSGKKTYVVKYRLSGWGDRTRRYTLGKHGAPWTPTEARKEARRILVEVAQGHDPTEEKAKARAGITVAALCDWYLEEGCTTKKEMTLVNDRSRIARHIKPLLGRKRVQDVTRGDIERFARDVANGKTALDEKTRQRGRSIVRGGKGTATRTLGLLGAIFTFAVSRGLREDNPVRGVKRWPDRKMNRFLSAAELAQLGEALREAQRKGENPSAVAAIRLLALTGCRRGEILGLRRDQVDFEHSCLRLDEGKTGQRVAPLGAPALEALASLPRIEGNPFMLPGSRGNGHLADIKKPWQRIRARAGLEGVRLHDLRHSYASVGASGGDSLIIIGALLGHKQAATTQRYSHLSDDPVRAAADRISSHIAAAMNSGSGDGAEVVELDQKRRPRPRKKVR